MNNIAGIFIIDTRLTTAFPNLAKINQLLKAFYDKFPRAYFTICFPQEHPYFSANFERLEKRPFIKAGPANPSAPLFDTFMTVTRKVQPLLEVYHIDKVYCVTMTQARDVGSVNYTLFDMRDYLEELRKDGWMLLFPFAAFETFEKAPYDRF